MGKIASLRKLKPYYRYLPYCSSIRNVGTKTNPIVEKQMFKTYPAYPWVEDGEDHKDEDPVEFIEACAEAGLVRWETKEQKQERIFRERPYGEYDPVSWEEHQNHMKNRNGENV